MRKINSYCLLIINNQLKFAIYTGSGAIALDDFSALNGPCPISSVCDFESGTCGWTLQNPTGGQYAFNLTQAANANWPGISDKLDHTTESEQGHFLEAANGKHTNYHSV